MADSSHVTLLRRMARMQGGEGAENPLTSSRAVRLVLAKAAQEAVGLTLSVSGVSENQNLLDAMLADLPADLMLVQLMRDGALVGLMGLDMQLRAAIVEVETMGDLLVQPAETRPATGTDLSLAAPLITRFLNDLPNAVQATHLAHWADDVLAGQGFASPRAAGLALADGTYRTIQMTVDLGATDRQGLLLIALPVIDQTEPTVPATRGAPDWPATFHANVEKASAVLEAQLHRFSLPLGAIESLQVGDVLPLPGCSVSSVRLIAVDGAEIARAKLGQSGGMRAVRIEAPPPPDLGELATAVQQDVPLVAAVDHAAVPDITDAWSNDAGAEDLAFAAATLPDEQG